jgi:hypothetical protein
VILFFGGLEPSRGSDVSVCASRVGLTPSPTCPSLGKVASAKAGCGRSGNQTGTPLVSPPRCETDGGFFMVKYVPKAKRVYDPKDPDRFSYERITPEAEAEFYRLIGDGPVAFTRPKAAPAPPAAAAAPAPEPPPPQAEPRPASARKKGRKSSDGQ